MPVCLNTRYIAFDLHLHKIANGFKCLKLFEVPIDIMMPSNHFISGVPQYDHLVTLLRSVENASPEIGTQLSLPENIPTSNPRSSYNRGK